MNRREFLRQSALLGSALAFHHRIPLLEAAEGRGIHLGLVTYNLARSWDIETIIRRCTAHRFEQVELRSTHAHGVEPNLDQAARQKVRDRFADSAVQLISLGSACEFHALDPAVVRKNIEETQAFIRLAAAVGARAVKVRPNGLPKERPVSDTLKQIGAALRELGAWSAAEGHDIALWLEVHGSGTSHVPHIKTIMEQADHPLVGVTWNCNSSDLIEGSCKENWMLVHQWVRCLHIHDLWNEKEYPWKELFGLLRKTEWSGSALWERGGEADNPDALMAQQRAAFDTLMQQA